MVIDKMIKNNDGSKVTRLMKYIFIFLGIASIILGLIGAFLPLIPTIPFLLFSAFLFSKSSQKLYDWLLNNKLFGKHLYNYKTHKAIEKKYKIMSIAVFVISFTVSIIMIDILYVRFILASVCIVVMVFISNIKTVESLNNVKL